jgi:hypothetical protein
MKALTTRWSRTGMKHIYLRNLNSNYPSPTLCGNWNPPWSWAPKGRGKSRSCQVCKGVLESALTTLTNREARV